MSGVDVESAGPVAAPIGQLLGDSLEVWRDRTRRELGLGVLGGAILTGAGHQATLWHPGILAKFVHARRVAGPAGSVVHLVVDHDVYEPSLVRVPVRRSGGLAVVHHRFGPAAGGVSAMAQRAFDPRRFEMSESSTTSAADSLDEPALASISRGLERAYDALASTRREPNAAEQVAAAVSKLAEPWCGSMVRVADSKLLASTLGEALVAEMRRDPLRCAAAFNRALLRDPRAARALHTDDDPELPLWILAADGTRERVTASRLASLPRRPRATALLPRAFLLSAFMRLGVCDRFVHGTGARRYERVTEAWFAEWLGVELPPIDIASATLTLPLMDAVGAETPESPTQRSRRRAWWDPESLDHQRDHQLDHQRDHVHPKSESSAAAGRKGPGPSKAAALDAIAHLPRRSAARREAYRRLQARLDELRGARAEAFAVLDERIAADGARGDEALIALDRTWPFAYSDSPSLDALFAPSTEAPPGAGAPGDSLSGFGR